MSEADEYGPGGDRESGPQSEGVIRDGSPLREPPAGLAAAASFGCLLEDEEQGSLADWTMDLGAFVQRIAALDPRRGPVDTHQMVEDAKALLEAGGIIGGTASEGMVRTEHGWARPCAACGSTDAGKPCPNTEDGFHVAGTPSEDTE